MHTGNFQVLSVLMVESSLSLFTQIYGYPPKHIGSFYTIQNQLPSRYHKKRSG